MKNWARCVLVGWSVGCGLFASGFAGPWTADRLLAQPAEVEWRVGPAFVRQLDAPVGVLTWQQVPLRQAVRDLARAQQTAVWLDRRIDPARPIDLAISNRPLRDVWQSIAQDARGGICQVEAVVYLGPTQVASRLATVAALRRQEASAMGERGRGFSKSSRMAWEEATAPRDLLAELAAEADVRFVDLEQFPHDLWPAMSLPPLTVADRLSLVLANFSLTYEIARDGSAVRVAAWPDSARLRKPYPAARDKPSIVEQARQQLPGLTIRTADGQIEAEGTWEDHEAFQRLLTGTRPAARKSDPALERFTLNVQNKSAAAVLKTLADGLGLMVIASPAAQEKLAQRVSFNVREAPLRQLLAATLDPLGLSFRLEGQSLIVALKD